MHDYSQQLRREAAAITTSPLGIFYSTLGDFRGVPLKRRADTEHCDVRPNSRMLSRDLYPPTVAESTLLPRGATASQSTGVKRGRRVRMSLGDAQHWAVERFRYSQSVICIQQEDHRRLCSIFRAYLLKTDIDRRIGDVTRLKPRLSGFASLTSP